MLDVFNDEIRLGRELLNRLDLPERLDRRFINRPQSDREVERDVLEDEVAAGSVGVGLERGFATVLDGLPIVPFERSFARRTVG